MRKVILSEDTKKDILENLLKRSPNSYGKFEASVAAILADVKEKAMRQYSITPKIRWCRYKCGEYRSN